MKAIGLDVGTTSICGICCDAETGEIIQSVTAANDSFINTGSPWEKVQDPGIILKKLKTISAELLDGRDDIASIGVTGQMHGIVYVDGNGNPVSRLYTWQDGRGDLPFSEGETYASYLSEKTGYSLSSGFGGVTHFYNTVNNLIPESAKTFCTIHDLAVMALTDVSAPQLHPSDAASFGFFDLKRNCFDLDTVRACSMDASFFPEVKSGYMVTGKTPQSIPVAAAIGDNQASVIGSVSDLKHSVLINIGTGGQISCAVPSFIESGDMELRPLTDGLFLLAGSSLCGGRAYAVLERFLRETASLVSEREVKSAYPAMDRLMEDFSAPENPLSVSTLFCGTRKNPALRGSVQNIDIENLTMGNLCYGVMKGMIDELHGQYTEILPLLNEIPCRLIGSGNGIRNNKPLAELTSRIFGMPLLIPVHKEEAAFGSALFGMTAAGIYSELSLAQTLIHYKNI